MKRLLLSILMIVLFSNVWGQIEGNLRSKKITTQSDTVYLDSLTISPGTVTIIGADSSDYEIDYPNGVLIWISPPPVDSVSISFRTWPIRITQPVYHKPLPDFVPDESGRTNPFSYQGNSPPQPSFSTGKLDKSGSISRGMLFGNNQNLGLNSNLNLQLAGELTPDISIKAVISDNNIPVQPDGNTQLIQDFDQVYIQLYGKRWDLVAGDFRIEKPLSHFMVFDKRLRGAGGSVTFPIQGKNENKLSANVAVSRGKFSRNIFDGVEGNQGPYRLQGSENEAFIVILSGTEEVFIDGRKLTRGQEHDYIIDYNKAEIVFTAREPITKDKRIVVEFQYSAQAYGRSLIQISDNYRSEKLRLNFNLYSEQDNKSQPLLQELTDENKLLLTEIGDDINNAIVPGVKQVEFSSERVLYKLTVDPITFDTIYVYSTNPDSARYQLAFTNVGFGNGNYIEIESTANGRVFEYVPPIAGVSQGAFEPVVLLITPKKRQMFTVGGDYELTKTTRILMEGVLTQNDLNTYSEIGNQNDIGGGFLVGVETIKKITNDTVVPWFMKTKVTYENRSDNFEVIQRYRSVEFDRNWNIRGLQVEGMQQVPTADVAFFRKGLGELGYQFKSFIAGTSYRGFRNQLSSNLDNKKFTANIIANVLSSSGDLGNTTFNRHKIFLQKKYKSVNIGFRDDFEHNLKKEPGVDTLSTASYSFWEWEAFITQGDSMKNTFKLAYNYRVNDNVKNNALTRSTLGQSIIAKLGLVSNPKAQLQLSSMYRVLDVIQPELYFGSPEQTLTNRIDYSLRLVRGALNLASFFEVGSGLTEEQAFIYVEVPAGTGVYTWIDYNDNGVAEQNEFEIAQFQDQATYVRILTQTNNFEKIYRTQFNQTVFLSPAAVWSSKKGLKGLLSKFSNQLAYRIDRKTDDNTLEEWLNPFSLQVADSSIRSLNSSLRNTVYLNRASKLWSIDYTYQETGSKLLQTVGLTGLSDVFNQLNFRYNLSPIYQLNFEWKAGEKASGAQFYSDRNYLINYTGIKPSVTYLQGSGVKIKLYFEQIEKQNQVDLGGERNLSKTYGAEVNVRKVGKGSLIISGNYRENAYEGNTNSPIAYQMLDGLQPGKNGIWEVTYQRTIAKYLQLNLRYNGRSSEDSPVVHTGSIQVRAFF